MALPPATYGYEAVRLGQAWPDAYPGSAFGPAGKDRVLPQQAIVAAERSETRTDNQALVTQLEVTTGPYSAQLSEPLMALGRSYSEAGDYDLARSHFRRALHIVRVNDGLYSAVQAPILRELLNTFRLTADAQALDDRYDYLFQLYGSGQRPFTEVRLRASLEYLRWQREALRLGLEGDDKRRLLKLLEINESLLAEVNSDPSVSFSMRRSLVLSQLRNFYLLQDRVRPRTTEVGLVQYSPFAGLPGESGPGDKSFNQTRLETYQRRALRAGEELLQTLQPTADLQGVEEGARIRLEMADWYQWNGADGRAQKTYVAVADQLVRAGRDDLLNLWLGQPRELPDNGTFWQPPSPLDEQQRVVISARFKVSARGQAAAVETRAHKPEDEGEARWLARYLTTVRFRPRYLTGQAESVEEVAFDYEVRD
jgi:hypothetical protein